MYETYALRAASEKSPWQFSTTHKATTRREAAIQRNNLLTPDDAGKSWPMACTKFPSGRLVFQSIPCHIAR